MFSLSRSWLKKFSQRDHKNSSCCHHRPNLSSAGLSPFASGFRLQHSYYLDQFLLVFEMTTLSPTSASTISVFDPTTFPIRSCIRPVDELFSNCGMFLKKHVSFNENVEFIEENVFQVEHKVELVRPRAWRIKQKNENQFNAINKEQVFLDPYSIWDISHNTPITLNNSKRKDMMVIEYEEAPVHSPKFAAFPVFSCVKSPNRKRHGHTVRFAFTQSNILPNGSVYDSVATVEAPSDYWKPGAMDNFPIYKLNCNKI